MILDINRKKQLHVALQRDPRYKHFVWQKRYYAKVFAFYCSPVTDKSKWSTIYGTHVGLTNKPEFYGDLVYKFKKLIGSNDFSFQFRKIITRYRRIGYNLNVMRQSACLVFNPITVDNYAAFFNCKPVGRASDSMMAPT